MEAGFGMAMDDERINRLLREGRITHEEAERLRAAWLRSPEANAPLPRSAWLRPSRLASVVAVTAVLGAAAFVAGRLVSSHRANLVRNSGFEDGVDEPRDWSAQNLSGEARFLAVVGDAPQGRRFGRIEKASDRSMPIDSWTQDLGAVPAARRLDVSLWARTRDVRQAIVDLQFYAAGRWISHRSLFELPPSSPWTRLEREVPVPDAATTLSLAIQLPGPGVVDIDEVCVEPIPEFRFRPGEELVANGDFDDIEGAIPVGWVPPRPPDGVEYVVEVAPPRRRVATVRSAIDTSGFAFVGWTQSIDRFPTQTDLELRADVRASASGVANVEWIVLDASDRPIVSQSLISPRDQIRTLEWRRWTETVRLPVGARVVELRCVLRGQGAASFDGVSLRVPEVR